MSYWNFDGVYTFLNLQDPTLYLPTISQFHSFSTLELKPPMMTLISCNLHWGLALSQCSIGLIYFLFCAVGMCTPLMDILNGFPFSLTEHTF